MDIIITMASGRTHVVPKVSEEDFQAMLQGWADPDNFIVGIPGTGEGQLKFLVRAQIEMMVVDIVR